MNLFTAIMLIFAAIGFFDKIIGDRFGLTKSFNDGLATMSSMIIPTVGVCCVGTALIQNNLHVISKIVEPLPFDASMFAGLLLAPDMGGYFVAEQLTSDESMLIFNGVVLGALLGQMMTFQLPVFLSMLDKKYHPPVLKGFMVGIIFIPAGLIVAGIMLKIPVTDFMIEFIPILIICVLLTLGLLKKPEEIVNGFSVFANGIQIIIHILFFFSVLGLFVPGLAYASTDSVEEAVTIVFRSSVVICGSLVLSELILKFFRSKLQWIAKKMGVNEVTVVGLLLNCATSLAMLPLMPRMDDKGKMINGAFCVSGAYFVGGQLGFVSSVTGGYAVTVMVITKVISGFLSVIVMCRLYNKLKINDEKTKEACI